jgi:hypothetical protein
LDQQIRPSSRFPKALGLTIQKHCWPPPVR